VVGGTVDVVVDVDVVVVVVLVVVVVVDVVVVAGTVVDVVVVGAGAPTPLSMTKIAVTPPMIRSPMAVLASAARFTADGRRPATGVARPAVGGS
jgi:hypothetical protein